jgi:hypothetical protein
MNKKIDPELIQESFYKAKENNDYLESLYENIQFIIDSVTNNKAKRFRKKYPQDFEDIQQGVKIEIWRVFNKLLNLSYTADQFIRILISAISFSFRSNYKRLKKTLPVSVGGGYINVDWKPDEDVPIEITIETVFGQFGKTSYDTFKEKKLREVGEYPSEYVDSSIDLAIDLSTLNEKVFFKALELNRFKKDTELMIIEFCLASYLRGREPSRMLISSFFNNGSTTWFFLNYSKVLLKIALLTYAKELAI